MLSDPGQRQAYDTSGKAGISTLVSFLVLSFDSFNFQLVILCLHHWSLGDMDLHSEFVRFPSSYFGSLLQ